MFVGVDQLAGLDGAAENFDFATPADWPAMGVANTESPREGFEPGVGHFVDVADGAVGDRADATERAMGIAVHFAPERTDDAGFVEILDDDDLGAWGGADEPFLPPRFKRQGGSA